MLELDFVVVQLGHLNFRGASGNLVEEVNRLLRTRSWRQVSAGLCVDALCQTGFRMYVAVSREDEKKLTGGGDVRLMGMVLTHCWRSIDRGRAEINTLIADPEVRDRDVVRLALVARAVEDIASISALWTLPTTALLFSGVPGLDPIANDLYRDYEIRMAESEHAGGFRVYELKIR